MEPLKEPFKDPFKDYLGPLSCVLLYGFRRRAVGLRKVQAPAQIDSVQDSPMALLKECLRVLQGSRGVP